MPIFTLKGYFIEFKFSPIEKMFCCCSLKLQVGENTYIHYVQFESKHVSRANLISPPNFWGLKHKGIIFNIEYIYIYIDIYIYTRT